MSEGIKHDHGKPMWDLLPWPAVKQIVQVLTFGAEKYARDNWKDVPDQRNRYFAAMQRHITDWFGGEKLDPESGYRHLAHAGCCLLFLLTGDQEK